MAVAEKTLNYVKLASTYFTMWRNSLPFNAKSYQPLLIEFAQFLSTVDISSFIEIDSYIEVLSLKLTEQQQAEVLAVLEQFFEFLISRGYCLASPFRPSNSPVQNPMQKSEVNPSLHPPASHVPNISVPIVPLDSQQQVNPQKDINHPLPVEIPSAQTIPQVNPQKPTALSIEELDLYFDEFLDYRRNEGRRLEESSIASYVADYRHFKKFLISQDLVFNLNSISIYARHLNSLERKHDDEKNPEKLATKTVARRKNSFKSFLQFVCNKKKYIDLGDEWQDILYTSRKDKIPEKAHKAISLDEMNQIVAYLGTSKDVTLRQKIELLSPPLTGLRADELVNLKLANIDFAKNTFNLTHTKGSKARSVSFADLLIPFLKDYIMEEQFGEEDYLFPTRQSGHMTPRTLNDHISEICKAAGIKRNITAHDFRSTHATYLFRYKRENASTVQKTLGHSDINTTFGYNSDEGYSENDPKLKDIYEYWKLLLYPEGFPYEKINPIPSSETETGEIPLKKAQVIAMNPSFKKQANIV